MENGLNSLDSNTNSSVCIPTFGKGSIVLTPSNFIGRVMWVQEPDFVQGDPKVSIEYLELHGAYSVYNMSELRLVAQSAETPKYDIISEQKLSWEREKYLKDLEKVTAYVKSGKVKRIKEADPLELALKNLSAEQLNRIMEILK